MKKIRFISLSERTREIEPAPKPSKLLVPEWYKKTSQYHNAKKGSNSVVEYSKNMRTAEPSHGTYKLCVPFVDAIASGYVITLPATIIVHQEKDENGNSVPFINWLVDFPLADARDALTIPNFPIPTGHSSQLFRWLNNWKIETPVGYSSLFMHPVHRNDLPFTTVTGFVDTDKHPNPLILPFFLKEGFEGEIPMGTPIAQVFPIKRESWTSEIAHSEEANFGDNVVKQTFYRAYKQFFWSKKDYS